MRVSLTYGLKMLFRSQIVFLACALIGAHAASVDLQRDELTLRQLSARFYNGNNVNQFVTIPATQLENLLSTPGFSVLRNTVIYFHGYTENLDVPSVHTVVSAYLARGNINVVAIDHSALSGGDYILNAVPNSRRTGSAMALKIKHLVDSGLRMPLLHIVGHSLGAHVSGFMGKNLQSSHGLKLRRISALDPAGPGFHPMPSSMRLDASDADIVDSIITDAAIFGYPAPIGTATFWPNEGNRYQPGCPEVSAVHPEAFCSHHRSWRFWAESLLNPNAFLARDTTNTEAVMGWAFDGSVRGDNFRLRTNAASPFGLGSAGLP